jgi:hypothetical protein
VADAKNGSRDDIKVGNWDDNDAKRDVVEVVKEDNEKVARVDARSGNDAKRDVNERGRHEVAAGSKTSKSKKKMNCKKIVLVP